MKSKCVICGKEYEVVGFNTGYCSIECKREAVRRMISRLPIKHCDECGNEFKPVGMTQRYCSKECKQKATNRRAKELAIINKHKRKKVEFEFCKRKDTCLYGGYIGGVECCDYTYVTGRAKDGYGVNCPHYKPKEQFDRRFNPFTKEFEVIDIYAEGETKEEKED